MAWPYNLDWFLPTNRMREHAFYTLLFFSNNHLDLIIYLIIFQFEDHTITSIFSRIVLWHLDTKGFAKEFDPCIDQIVTATLEIHKFVVGSLLPTPDHSHYLFSLKEFSRVICGCLLSVPETMEDLNAMKRLWVHEVFRVYYDRLTTEVRFCL